MKIKVSLYQDRYAVTVTGTKRPLFVLDGFREDLQDPKTGRRVYSRAMGTASIDEINAVVAAWIMRCAAPYDLGHLLKDGTEVTINKATVRVKSPKK